MTEPAERAEAAHELPNLIASLMIDPSDPKLPLVILRLENAGVAVDFRIDARKAAQFGTVIGQGLIAAAGKCLAEAGPQLVTPPAAGSLIIPGPNGTLPPTNGRRS